MPVFLVTDSQTGRKLRLTGDSPPTDAELEGIFAQQGGQDGIPITDGSGVPDLQADRQQPGITGEVGAEPAQPSGFPGAEIIEPAAALISAAVAEPIAGAAGIVKGLLPGEEGDAARAVEATREALTFQPRTEEGKAGLQAVAETLEPVSEALKGAETFLGDETFAATGSPALAAAATTIPTVMLEVLGVAGAKGAVKIGKKTREAVQAREVKRNVIESAPGIDQLKETSRAVYKELDDSGVTITKDSYSGLVNKIKSATSRAGIDADVTPDSFGALKRLEKDLGSAKSLTQIDILREVASGARGAVKPNDKRIAEIIVDNIDDFLDNPPKGALKGAKASEIGPKYKIARELWGRARRSEIINEAFERAKDARGGMQSGLASEFKSITRNRKLQKFFKPGEIEAMRKVSRGTGPVNLALLIGKFGMSEGQAARVVLPGLGAAGGFAVAGPTGALAVPVIGQVSRNLAQRLTRNNASFADTVVRAGTNADAITKAYLKNTPKGKRLSSELSELLLRPDIPLDDALGSSNVLLREAAEIAKGTRTLEAVAATAAGAGAIKEQ